MNERAEQVRSAMTGQIGQPGREDKHDGAPAQRSVLFDGKWWRVANARYDASGFDVGSHWHLTLTGPLHGEDQLDAIRAATFQGRSHGWWV